MRRAIVGFVVAAAVLVSGCGRTVIVGSSIASQINQMLSARIGVPIKKVHCPDAPDNTGAAFTCQVVGGDGSSASVRVTIINAKTRRFRYPLRFVRTGVLAQIISNQILSAAHIHATTVCRQIVRLPPAGTHVTCQASGPAGFHRKVYVGITGAGKPTTARFVKQ